MRPVGCKIAVASVPTFPLLHATAANSAPMHPLLWSPKAYHFGDITLVHAGGQYHLFSEMMPLVGGGAGQRVVGHAVSPDLFSWEELPPVLVCGAPGEFDAYSIYHMDAFLH